MQIDIQRMTDIQTADNTENKHTGRTQTTNSQRIDIQQTTHRSQQTGTNNRDRIQIVESADKQHISENIKLTDKHEIYK